MTNDTDPDTGAKLLARWIGYAWEGLQEGRIADRGYPQWAFNGLNHRQFQGGKQDLRDLAAEIVAVTVGETEQTR